MRATAFAVVCSLAILSVFACGGEDSTGPEQTTSTSRPTKLAFTPRPPGQKHVAGEQISPAFEVTIQDATGSVVSSATNAVTLAIGQDPSGSTLSGTTTVNASAGVATFSDLSIDQRGGGYTLVAMSGDLARATSDPFNIAFRLVFVVEPSTTDLNEAITPPVQVAIHDAAGNVASGATDRVEVGVATSFGENLTGTLAVNAVAGTATFDDLTIDKVESGYTLQARGDSALTSVTSGAFDITMFDYAAVSTGTAHACALSEYRDVYCWGDGWLGNSSTTYSDKPVLVEGGLSFTAVSVGNQHTCGIVGSSDVYCWGRNQLGQLGNGNAPIETDIPVKVQGGHMFASVSASSEHTCGVTQSGDVYCWGDNSTGELGDGTTTSSDLPVLVSGMHTFTMVSAAVTHTCGVTLGGNTYCWGLNGGGQLGDGTTNSSSTPVLVSDGHTFASVSAGGTHFNGAHNTCGVTTIGDAYCWGLNLNGQLGNGNSPTGSTTPVAVQGGLVFASLTNSSTHNCGITTDGTAYCWGLDGFGELGNGSSLGSSDVPSPVSGDLTFASVGVGGESTCGVTNDGVLYCWGEHFASAGRSDAPFRIRDP